MTRAAGASAPSVMRLRQNAAARKGGSRSPARRQRATRLSKRLAAAAREQQILDEAVRFFAEVGFNGQTRELAQRIGITQPLLYRYFPTKRDLIDRVFKEVFLKRIDPQWSRLIANRALPLEERLVTFYEQYARAIYNYEWIRIYMFAALMGEDLNRRYIKIIEEKILKPICIEIRHHCGLALGDAPVSEAELEHVWVMHGGLFYYAVRKYVDHSRVGADFTAIVRRAVSGMLAGVAAIGVAEPSGRRGR